MKIGIIGAGFVGRQDVEELGHASRLLADHGPQTGGVDDRHAQRLGGFGGGQHVSASFSARIAAAHSFEHSYALANESSSKIVSHTSAALSSAASVAACHVRHSD